MTDILDTLKAFFTNIGTLDRYLPGIMMVVYANSTPLEAIQKVEG